jgi:hypothetical protein
MRSELALGPKGLIRALHNVLTIHTEDLVFPVHFQIQDGCIYVTTASRYVLAKDVCNKEKSETDSNQMVLDVFETEQPKEESGLDWEGFISEEDAEKLLEFLKTIKDLKRSPGSVLILESETDDSLVFRDEATGNEIVIGLSAGFYGNESNADAVMQAMLTVTEQLEECRTTTYAVNPEFFSRARMLKREYDGAPFTFQFFKNRMSGVTTCVVKYCRMRLYVAGINLDTAFKHITDTLGEKVAQECFWDRDKD